MIVVDTSIFVDYLFEANVERNKVTMEFIIEGLKVLASRIFLIELISVAKRLDMKFISIFLKSYNIY